MALLQSCRALLHAVEPQLMRAVGASASNAAAGVSRAASPPSAPHVPPPAGPSGRRLHTSPSPASGGPPQPPIDPFTQSLQSKTEQELLALLQQRLAQQQGGEAGDAEGEESDGDTGEAVNPETGEIGGPKGKEPTRFGDWERSGRAIDF